MNEILKIIIEQLGRQFCGMVGCKQVLYSNKTNTLTFILRNNFAAKKINRFVITYNEGKDLYEFRFYYVRGTKTVLIEEHTEVYVDDMHDVFEQTTGLLTHM